MEAPDGLGRNDWPAHCARGHHGWTRQVFRAHYSSIKPELLPYIVRTAQAGIPPEQVLRIATIGAARVARAAPERTISDIRNPRVVIKDGVVFRSEDLFRAVGMAAGRSLSDATCGPW